MIAEIANDLNQALLGGGAGHGFLGRAAEQTLPGQPQHRIVFGGRPVEVVLFEEALDLLVFSLDCPNPKPGQDHIDGEIRHPRLAQQRMRLREAR